MLTPTADDDPDVVAAIDNLVHADIPAELIVSAPSFDIVEQVWFVDSPADHH